MIKRSAILLVLALGQAARPSSLIDSSQLLRDLQTLSADDMQGRQADTPGGEKARAYVIERLKASGVVPFGESYAAPFTFVAEGAGRRGGAAPRRQRGRTHRRHASGSPLHCDFGALRSHRDARRPRFQRRRRQRVRDCRALCTREVLQRAPAGPFAAVCGLRRRRSRVARVGGVRPASAGGPRGHRDRPQHGHDRPRARTIGCSWSARSYSPR